MVSGLVPGRNAKKVVAIVVIAPEVSSWKTGKRVYSHDHINTVTMSNYDSLDLIKAK